MNKNSPWTHTKLEFDMLGVIRKLVEYVVRLSIEKDKNKYFSSHRLPKQ
jgi:hypothetical protein